MKKIFSLLALILLSVGLVACADSSEEETQSNNEEINMEDTSTEEPEEENDNEESDVSDTSFDNGDYVYEIKSIEQITGNDDETQVLAIELTFTNNTDEPVSPWMALGLHAEQETDTTVETLIGANGRFPDDYKPELVEMGDSDIKSGATVDAVIGYEIMYPGSPVRLTNFSMTDELLFEKVVETTE